MNLEFMAVVVLDVCCIIRKRVDMCLRLAPEERTKSAFVFTEKPPEPSLARTNRNPPPTPSSPSPSSHT